MIKTLTHHYRRIPSIGRVLLGILFFLGVFLATFRFMYADLIPFESNLSTIFPWLNTGYYSNTHFMYGGNNFVGIIFWSGSETVVPAQNIMINGGAQSINCSTHLRGIYYNNQRGRRIWPLDTGNLALLSGSPLATGYGTMTMTGGFYTNCVTAGGGYIPASNEVYGQIDHTLGSQTGFRMIAGVNYNFGSNAINGSTFGHTLTIATGGTHSGYIFDTNGGIAELNMNVPWCQDFQSINNSGFTIPQGTNTTFTCYGSNVSGYLFRIFTSGGVMVSQFADYPYVGTSDIRRTGASLATGDYYSTCTVLQQGGLGGPQCGIQIPFHVGGTGTTPPIGTGCNPNFQGEISFASSFGSTVINPSLATYYTNKTGIMMQLAATEPTHFVVSGDFLGTPWARDYIGNSIYTPIPNPISLTNINTWNYFISTYTTGACSYIDANKRVYVDTIPPTTPVILSPANGTNSCPSTPLSVTRSVSSDTGSQLGSLPVNYRYEIYSNSGMTMTGFMLSGTTTSTGAMISTSLLPLGTYYMRIVAIDMVGNASASTTLNFTTSQQYCTAGTGIVIVTPTIWLRNVDLDKIYRSDPIWILGLTGPTLINISKGMLFVNNGTGLGTTGIVTSTDTIYIEVVSSNQYDTTVTSNLTIAGLTGTFAVTTKQNGCILSAAEKLVIQNIYADLKNQYDNDLSKLSEFLNTFQSMVHDESILSNSCTLEYLLSLIEADMGSNGGIDTSNHITPNCKEYSIGYDITQQAYYAPEMMIRYYFINRESLIRHLDYYNPGDCHINTYGNNFRTNDTNDSMTHIAPNGKIYHLVGQYGGFSAAEFTSPKYFDSLASINMYIDLRNPAKEIWKHILDTTFTPIVFAAPNGREYRIYKTDRGFMSYKLMKVKYYQTLSDLKNYINRNNPSKR